MKLLLINPTAPQWRADPVNGPARATRVFRFSMLTSLTVAAALPDGVEAEIVDEELEPINLDTDADLIGISFMTYNAPRAYALADEFRERGKTVIFGGYHPTLVPEEAKGHADAVCIGEAEPNLPEMIADYASGRLRPYYQNGTADLAALKVPNRSLLRSSGYAWVDALQATRGCPHACTFCSISAFHQRRYRVRPVEQVLEEMKGLGRHLIFMDDNLTADPDYAESLFAHMIPLKKRWVSQTSTALGQNPRLMDLAARSGCAGVFMGLETISEQALAGWNKRFNHASDYKRLVQQLHNRGIAVIAGIVFGHDADTTETFDRTVRFLREARIDALQATILTPFPGTALHAQMESRIVDRNWAHYDFSRAVFEPARMSREQLEEGHQRVLQNFYSPGAICRRVLLGAGYLRPSTLLRGSLCLNIGYRARLKACGIINASGLRFPRPRNSVGTMAGQACASRDPAL